MKIIKPVGFDLVGARLTPFYSKGAIKLIKNKTGNLLTDTKGLISEFQFGIMSGLSRIARYRKKGIVKPVGHAITNAKDVTAFYSLKQVNEFKKSLGVTLKSTKGLLVEKKFIEVSGFSEIAKYRKKGLIKPTGFALTSGGLSAFYHPRQIKELKQKLGITLTDTKGLISERRARDIAGLRKIKEHREKGLIKPYGTGMSNSGISKFYHPKQLKKLLKNLKENKSKNNRNS